jgi:F420-0:gamma-glutamyl ligase-like protein
LKLKVKRFETKYWRPGTNVIKEITTTLEGHLADGDLIVISEKALATATNNVIDEASVKPGSMARFLANFWMRKVWGGPIGIITRLKPRTLENIRSYPQDFGARHKQLSLRTVGFLQALRHYSEGGIDASNLPYTLVSLPLQSPAEIAEKIKNALQEKTMCKISVMIVDGDATYSWRNLHLSPRQVDVPGLIHINGFLTFIIGRVFNLKSRPTPVALVGKSINPDRALWLAKTSHKISGPGAGRTVWGMSRRFDTSLTGVTLEMLESVVHAPIVVLRLEDDSQKRSSSCT